MIHDNPLFSVVIPAYNVEGFVLEALDSVAGQTFTDYEVVVVDDGSTDATFAKVDSWTKEHSAVKLKLVQQANKGIGGARNTGISHASGIFVAFLDADDVWLEQKLEFVVDIFKKVPGVDVVCHDVWAQDKARKKRKTCGPYTTYRDLFFRGDCIFTSATVARREKILETGCFSEDMQFNGVEDYDLWLRLARAGCRIEYLNKILGVYRLWGQGITNNIVRHNQNAMNLLDAHFQMWHPKSLYYRCLIRQRRAITLRGGGHVLMKGGNHREAQRYLTNALKQDPLSWKTWTLALLNFVRISK